MIQTSLAPVYLTCQHFRQDYKNFPPLIYLLMQKESIMKCLYPDNEMPETTVGVLERVRASCKGTVCVAGESYLGPYD